MITYDPTGTITFSGFDDDDRTLTRPKLGQFRWFNRRFTELRTEAVDKLTRLGEEAASDDPEISARAEKELHDMAQNPFWEQLLGWYRDLFDQLSTGLPETEDDWPSYFTDPSLPSEIMNHWRQAPKASGPPTKG